MIKIDRHSLKYIFLYRNKQNSFINNFLYNLEYESNEKPRPVERALNEEDFK